MKFDINKLVRKNISNLTPYSSAREEYTGNEGVFLDANENPFGSYNRYPDPYQKALKAQLSKLKNIESSHIFIGNGSDEVIDIAYRIFCEPNKDKALTFSPTYGMYEVSAQINAVELIKVPLNKNFQIDIENTIPYLKDEDLKLIFICSPNNPTGNFVNANDIEFILENFNGIVIVDEAYIDFCKEPSFITKIKKYPNLIVSQTMSKAWGLAGVRLGIAYMNSNILSYYNKVKAPYNISALNQEKALEVLQNQTLFQKQVQEILNEKEQLIIALQKIKIIRKIYPSDANFILVEVNNADNVYEQLISNKIIVRNRNAVVKNCIRITIGSAAENQQLLTILKNIDYA